MYGFRARWGALAIGTASLLACGPAEKDTTEKEDAVAVPTAMGLAPIAYKQVEDNLQHDTLLIQTTFDLGDGTFVMVASHVQDTFEGLRLYRYRPGINGAPEMLAISNPGYDSWTMLPTFFGDDPKATNDLWVLANFGERESWGQKVMRLGKGFTDIGFLDLAYPERMTEDGVPRLKRNNIAPYMRMHAAGDSTVFTFDCDSVFVYDDLNGSYDIVLPAASVWCIHREGQGLSLWINGEERVIRDPI